MNNFETKRWRTDEVGLFDVNFDTGECYWSSELRHIWGISEDAPAEFARLLERVHPEDRRRFALVAMEPFRPDCPPHRSNEFRILQNDGAVRWLHVERVAIFRADTAHDAVRVAGFVVETSAPMPRARPRTIVDLGDGFSADGQTSRVLRHHAPEPATTR